MVGWRQQSDNVGPQRVQAQVRACWSHAEDKPDGPAPSLAADGGVSGRRERDPCLPAHPECKSLIDYNYAAIWISSSQLINVGINEEGKEYIFRTG